MFTSSRCSICFCDILGLFLPRWISAKFSGIRCPRATCAASWMDVGCRSVAMCHPYTLCADTWINKKKLCALLCGGTPCASQSFKRAEGGRGRRGEPGVFVAESGGGPPSSHGYPPALSRAPEPFRSSLRGNVSLHCGQTHSRRGSQRSGDWCPCPCPWLPRGVI